MEKSSKIYVAGHRGLTGSAIVRQLTAAGYENIMTRAHAELDLEDAAAADAFFATEKPDHVFLAAAMVGGLFANKARPAEFFTRNVRIQTNVIDAAWRHGVKKLLFLGSSCIYPRICDRVISENDLLTAPLEPTNDAYAVAKIAGLKMCEFYRRQYGFDAIAVMPPNLYGPNDNFHVESAHVMQGLMRRMTDAREAGDDSFTIWGTGTPRREFLHVDDLADAAVFLMNHDTGGETLFNVGTGEDISIHELAEKVRDIVGFGGRLETDPSKPDGTPRKTMDVSRMFALGWRPQIPLAEGMRQTYDWFIANRSRFAAAPVSAGDKPAGRQEAVSEAVGVRP